MCCANENDLRNINYIIIFNKYGSWKRRRISSNSGDPHLSSDLLVLIDTIRAFVWDSQGLLVWCVCREREGGRKQEREGEKERQRETESKRQREIERDRDRERVSLDLLPLAFGAKI